MVSIIDTNVNTASHLATLKGLGVQTIIRYIRPFGGPGQVSASEARAIAAHGMRLGLVLEGKGNEPGYFSGAAGARDATRAFAFAPTVGAPKDPTLWFAVDFDAGHIAIQGRVLPYFKAIKEHFVATPAKVGVYGSGAVCSAIIGAGAADYAWLSQSMGWTNSRAYRASNKWVLLQGADRTIGGCDADSNEHNAAAGPLGDFVPWGDTAPPLDIKWLQAQLNKFGAQPPLMEDGVYGAATEAAVKTFQGAHNLKADGDAGPQTVATIKGLA